MLHASSTEEAIALEAQYGAKNYASLPIVIARGKDTHVWDPEGREYLDFLSGICAVAQGHCHPKIVKALTEQAERLTLPSRAFYSDAFGPFAKFATQFFGYERLLMMNTGVEAWETAMKLCRKWGHVKKGLPAGEVKIISCAGNFHGRTLTAISANQETPNVFGPFMPGFIHIPYNDIPALEKALQDKLVAGFVVEPVQGEAGVVVPTEGYLKKAAELCKKANVLLIADEIQSGIGRTGKLLAAHHENVKPDIVLLGKSLSGGMFPISAVLADDAVMSAFQPGDHGSTFGGNPLACVVATAALEVVRDEGLVENSYRMGKIFREELKDLKGPVKEVRGMGLLNAAVIDAASSVKAEEFCIRLKNNGLIAKNTRDSIIRFAPPLTIKEGELREACAIIRKTLI